jgi:hypothetical protein
MADKNLNQCSIPGPDGDPNIDQPSNNCGPDITNQPYGSQKDVLTESATERRRRTRLGQSANCDPMQQSGWGLDAIRENPSRETINRYSQVFRAADEAMKDLFDDVTVEDDNGKAHKVPIKLSTPEKAVAFILQENVRKDPTFVVDRIILPLLSLNRTDFTMDQSRYIYHGCVNWFRGAREDQKPGWTTSETGRQRDTVFGKAWGIPINISYQLNAWALYTEDMNQILEQIQMKFSPVAYIRIQDVNYETIVKLDSTGNNKEAEPGDKNVRVIKYQFNLTVETYIPQPIVRKKAVLDVKIDILNANKDEILDVLDKMEIKAGE